MIRLLLRPRFLEFFVLPNLAFAILAVLLAPATLISIANAALIALSIGVCVAYHEPVVDILFGDEEMERTDWLALGIFISWFGQIIARCWSITWRWLGRPDWLENTHFTSYALWMLIFASAFHLAAPGSIGQRRVPTERWVKIGALVAGAVFVSIGGGYLLDWFSL